jgi:hypothetical protein
MLSEKEKPIVHFYQDLPLQVLVENHKKNHFNKSDE